LTDVAQNGQLAARLEEIWKTKPGWQGWISTVDHKEIGKRYIATSLVFLVLGGLEALMMRVQLSGPERHVLSPQEFNQFFTMHGVTMIFLYALPVLSGFSNFLWPLVFGSRDMAFPRLNALSYWIFLFAGLLMYSSFLGGSVPNSGWFSYVPFAEHEYNPGLNVDFYAIGTIFLGISTTVGSINFVVTLMKTRAPGMAIMRMPILVWGTLTASVSNLLAIPSLTVACVFLFLDRHFGMHFFDFALGGQPLLWQHLFWIFGHPWVYVVVLPAMGIVSDIIPVFSRRPLVGYSMVAFATVATGMLGFGVWMHHMFATGLPPMGAAFFGASSLIISIPSAVAVFAWIATIWAGRPVFTTAFLFTAGFVLLFTIGGVSGVMTAAVPLDWQLTDTYFVVAHLHYVLIGINVFPVVAGLYFWMPKMTGRLLNERLGKWNFWTMFIGFNLGFFPMHIAGMLGMPRRIYTYADGLGWNTVNLITTIGAFVFAFGVLLLLINVWWSLRKGEVSGPNPWGAYSLEWAMPSPPPSYNFLVIPSVVTRYPLWEDQLGTKERSSIYAGPALDKGRETIGTTPHDADPELIMRMPGDSFAPFLVALTMMIAFYGALFSQWWLGALGTIGVIVFSIQWMWPRKQEAAA
jgi:cytochrome c oxidase subunit 1/cytochrome c oxidase subunit I+III